MKDYPKVIGFIPAYNAANFIESTLDGLAAQQYPNFEIWICDDASTDRTSEICEKFAFKDHRFKVIKNKKNLGWFRTSENLWIEASRNSDYCFINPHDDYSLPGYISSLVTILEENPGATLAIPGMENLYPNLSSICFFKEASGKIDVISRTTIILKRNIYWWAAYQGLHRSKIVQKIFPLPLHPFGEKEFSLDLISVMKMGFYGYFLTSDQILRKKIYHEKSVSWNWKHNLVNRTALWITVLRAISTSDLPYGLKFRIQKKIAYTLVQMIKRKILLIK